ncbi:NAD(P)H-dependent flavin oxidoreductase [Numidum massiliense]|uniref:NAD(P)H-dependent flavin oxidoreductase n=1 Tax=Numidum massiliense TaxID=1522315 RepID=UPI0009393AF8|nr:nitronate monooxygenase family protein [Numidum massiliense]
MTLRIHTPLCERLQIHYPIVQAGMAGGVTSVDMVAGVAEAGGLGTLGAAYMAPEAIRQAIRNIRAKTERPFAVNLFATSLQDDFSRVEEVATVLQPIREKLGIISAEADRTAEVAAKVSSLQTPDRFTEQFEVLLSEQVPVISTAFGVLPEDAMREAHAAGCTVIAMVTTVQEAQLAEEKGAHVIVAQGSDAGGHRGTFDVAKHPHGANVGTFSLVPQIVDSVRIPVIAAGGIMDGRGLVAALALGAQGVQMGTQFLTTRESSAHPAYKQALWESTEESTTITNAFSGRPARGLRNAFIEAVESSGVAPLPFPSQNTITSDIRRAAAAQNEAQYMSLWAGQATRLLNDGVSAEEVIHRIVDEATRILR